MPAAALAQASIRPTRAALGADVEGVDPRAPDGVATIQQALRERLVVRLRGYTIDDLELTRLAERFGTLEGSPDYSRSRAVYVPESPLMTVVSNVTENGKAPGDAVIGVFYKNKRIGGATGVVTLRGVKSAKLTLIAIAMVLVTRIARVLRREAAERPADPIATRLRRMAMVSLACWAGAVTAGRLLAYTYTRLTATENISAWLLPGGLR